ncbi:MAG: hypothetical protein L0Z53_22565, partial [Acidobacteriales bacterium]|nr:hypothetical protein [Terriglobales bacterium]
MRHKSGGRRAIAGGLLLCGALVFAQEPKESDPAKPGQAQGTRAAEIERKREDKVIHPKPEKKDKVERGLNYVDDHHLVERLTVGYRGLNVRWGGLPAGSGFGMGPEYRLRSENWGSNFKVGAHLSTKLYEKYYVGWRLPRLASNHLALEFNAVHRNYPELDYFGPGPDSLKSARTDYRLE